MVKKIELKEFTNKLAMDMGLEIIKLARSREQHIGVEIKRLNHTVFLFLDDTLTEDRHNWLRRKANVAILFEESSLSVKTDLEDRNISLSDPYGLDNKEYLAKGGSIPIFVENAGMVGIITVTGLKDTDDHQLILDALVGQYI